MSVLTDPLEACLLDLLYELRDADVPLILGGGYGLSFHERRVRQSGERLLLSVIPPSRSTNDLDVFLRTELLADSVRLKPLREALDRLGFAPIPSAQNYQFARKFVLDGQARDVKVDLLAREPDPGEHPKLRYDARRVKPDPSVGVHAHTTPEAVAVEEAPEPLTITGRRTGGEEYTGVLFVPSAYAFLMMKLHALRDQWQEEAKEYGRKHALDLYGIVALLTEPEYARALASRARYADTPEGAEAGKIVAALFGSENGSGTLRVREHPNFPREAVSELSLFLETLRELFPTSGSGRADVQG
jgi:hypothetical protein